MPILEIFVVTSTAITFCVEFAYLHSERADNFTWVLQMLKEHITSGEVEVIVTDRDVALLNAVEYVFPKVVNLLCLFHVCQNVKAKCKMTVFPKKKQVQIMEAWEALVYSYDETQYYMNLVNFEGICSSSSIFNDNVHDKWLIPHKERFVEAWTNRVIHFGNTTTQRVQSAHWSLKRILQDNIGDICSVWETINSMIVLQHSKIIASFEKTIIQKVHRHSNRLYANLRGVVSKNVIDHIVAEFDRVKYVGIDKSECRCTVRRTHGLPCVCEIARYSMISRSIMLDVIHIWCTKLTFHDDGSSKPSKLSMKHEIKVIVKNFDELDVPGKIALKGKLREIVHPSTTLMCPLVDKVKTKGAPNKVWKPRSSVKKLTPRPSVNKVQQPRVRIFKDWLSVEIQKFIDNIINVGEDGNCAYRAVAALLGMSENFWAFIHEECVVELQEFISHYEIIYDGKIFVQQLIHNVYVEQVATLDNWIIGCDCNFGYTM
ncbi:uncharacterized protein [Cicer arietinum]|uniref:uncharacterized protein n=1 Tax=Cicer arietinum TaxID=3827 RepID=UPI003CC6019C